MRIEYRDRLVPFNPIAAPTGPVWLAPCFPVDSGENNRRTSPLWVGYLIPTHQRPFVSMKKALWYLIAGTRGGENRARIIRKLDERPRNANQLADELDVKYNTVRHHLELLLDHDVIEAGEQEYGKLYFLTEKFERHREEFESITDSLE